MELYEKTKDKALYACPDEICDVATFRGDSSICPACHSDGLLVRQPLDERGRPVTRPVA